MNAIPAKLKFTLSRYIISDVQKNSGIRAQLTFLKILFPSGGACVQACLHMRSAAWCTSCKLRPLPVFAQPSDFSPVLGCSITLAMFPTVALQVALLDRVYLDFGSSRGHAVG